MKQLMILMLLMFATITATAQTADDEFNAEVRKSIELQHMGETLENLMKVQMTSAFSANHISIENMDAFIKEISVVMKPKLEVILRKVYVDNYTLEDMKQMNAFWQRLSDKRPLNWLRCWLMLELRSQRIRRS
jgi:hypothetical protein